MRKPVVIRLIGDLRAAFVALVRQELALFKAESSEKLSHYRAGGLDVGSGALAAFIGSLLLFGALGVLLSLAFGHLGLGPALARFLGFAVVGLFVTGGGAALALASIKALSKEPLAPHRTLGTIHRIVPAKPDSPPSPSAPHPNLPSHLLEPRVLATQTQISRTLEQLTSRANPARFFARVGDRVQEHPFRWGVIAMGAGFLASLVVFRQLTRQSER